MLLVGIVGLLPVLRYERFSTENDSLLYCSLAQWYQDHSFGESTDFRPDQPLAHYAAIYQGAGYPLSPAFLLAGAQAGARASSPILVYPAVSTWGLVLTVGSLLAFGRRALRWPQRWLLPVGLALAAVVQPLTWAHHMGFLAQTFATPLLLAALLQLAQTLSPRRWTAPEALLAGLITAGLASAYPPFLPILGGGWAWWFAGRVRHRSADAGRLARWALLVFAVTGALVVAQRLHLPGAFAFLSGTLVGSHVDLSPWGFVQATLGAWFWTPYRLQPLAEHTRAAHLWLVPLYAWLSLRGLRVVSREGRGGPLLGCLAVLAAAVAWYGLVARDPWTAERGHSWNLFKLTQWAHALLVLVLIHGLTSLRHHPWGRWLGPALLVVPVALLPVTWSLGGRLGTELETFVGSSRPLVTWEVLRKQLAAAAPARVLAADTPAISTTFLPTYLGLLAYPNRLSGDWSGALWIPPNSANGVDDLWDALARGEPHAGGEAIIPVVTSLRGFVTDDVALLGGGIGHVKEPTAAHVLAILQPSDEEPGPGECVWIGRERTTLVAYSPRETTATLRLTARPGPAWTSRVQRVVATSQGESHEVRLTEYPDVDLPVLLGRGAGRVQIAFPDDGAGDVRRLCVLSMAIVPSDREP
jgi:hypothetical protein